jgi:hypothetical protein
VTIDRAGGEAVRRLRGGRRKGRRRARVAVDATGLAQGAVSTFFVRRMHQHGQKPTRLSCSPFVIASSTARPEVPSLSAATEASLMLASSKYVLDAVGDAVDLLR